MDSLPIQESYSPADSFSHTSEYDVIIVGGGPAGSTVATLLARWGRRVLVLEKACFPRHHIGESLLAGTTTLMKQLGVYDKVEQANFVHKFGATYIWGKSETPWYISFSEVSDENRYSFQVDRAKFDKILLDHSREMGAIVQEECDVTKFIQENGRVVGVCYRDTHTQKLHEARAKYCVDASGQAALLGSSQKLRKFNQTLRNFALYTYFRHGKPATEILPELKERDKGNIFVVAMEKGWIWYIPMGDDRYSVGVVTHSTLAKDLGKETRLDFYMNCLNSTPQIKYLLSEAEIETTALYSQSDWSYVCDSFKGPGYLMVGDAACFVDPILSTGVDLAMEGAFKAALALNTVLTTPELTDQAMDWYEEEYKTKASNFLHMAEHWYHGHRSYDAWFWKAKQIIDPSSNLSIRQAFILLSGGFITGAGSENLPALQSFGGFRPFQLRTIYENLDSGFTIPNDHEIQSTDVSSTQEASDILSAHEFDQLQVSFRENMRYRFSMLEQEDHLVPVIRVTQDIEGVAVTRLILPKASLPVLELIDGKRSVLDLKREILSSSSEQTPEIEHRVESIIQELYKQAAVSLIPSVAHSMNEVPVEATLLSGEAR